MVATSAPIRRGSATRTGIAAQAGPLLAQPGRLERRHGGPLAAPWACPSIVERGQNSHSRDAGAVRSHSALATKRVRPVTVTLSDARSWITGEFVDFLREFSFVKSVNRMASQSPEYKFGEEHYSFPGASNTPGNGRWTSSNEISRASQVYESGTNS
jgi:hypothetical protein